MAELSAPKFSEKLLNWRIFKTKIVLSSAQKQLALRSPSFIHASSN
jgi:hypothetical protein